MKNYQYQILTYTHDQFSGEFVNVGVLLYSAEERFLKFSGLEKFSRITDFFPSANGHFILRQIKSISQRVNVLSKRLEEMLFSPESELSIISSQILPIDNSSLRFSRTGSAIDVDLDAALSDLYTDYVTKYLEVEHDLHTLSDEDVWKKKYKEYFEKYGVTKKLVKHEVQTKNDVFSFEKAWKNEIWHCYQPLSFSLQNADSIKDKVYKWAGKLQELKSTEEKINLTFLASISEKHNELQDFIFKYLNQDSENLEIHIVTESNAEVFAKETQEYMLQHETE